MIANSAGVRRIAKAIARHGLLPLVVAAAPAQVVSQAPIVLPGLEVEQAVFIPGTSRLLVIARETLFVHDVATRVTKALAAGRFDQLTVSPRGNGIAFVRAVGGNGPRVVMVWPFAADGSLVGEPRRVSTSAGVSPRFAPDGRVMAFVTRPTSSSSELRVVALPDGDERVLAALSGTVVPFWATDGSRVLARNQEPGATTIVMRDIALSGSTTVIDTILDATRVLYADGLSTVYRQRTIPGREARLVWKTSADVRLIPLPNEGFFLGEWDPVGMRVPLVVNEYPVTSAILDLASGRSSPIQVGGAGMRAPRWSPDGRLIAAQTKANDGRYSVTVFDVNRGTSRSYAIPATLINVQTAWSPSSRSVAVRTWEELWTLELATGTTRRVGPVLHPHHIVWRDDSTLATSRIINWPNGPPWQLRLFEETVGREPRLVRDVNAQFPGSNPLGYFATADAYVLLDPRRIVMNPLGGADTLSGEGPRVGAPGNTRDGKWLLLGAGQAGEVSRHLELIDVTGRAATMIPLPFEARTAGFNRPALLPDHRSAIVLGRQGPSSPWAFYHVALDRDSVRIMTTILGDPTPYHFDLSPDGKRLAYSFENFSRAVISSLSLTGR